jgi:glycosyltransferase involved in cell wall biosynthesis
VSGPVALVHGGQAASLARSSLAAAYTLVPFQGSPFALAAAVLRQGAHIVHVQNSGAHVAAAKLCGARVVLQISNPLNVENWALRLADAILVGSHEEREVYEALLPGRYVGVVAEGIDAAPYLKYNRRTPEAGSALKLLHFGEQAKPLEVLSHLREQGVSARLTIAGGAPGQTLLRAKARALGLAAQVNFAPPAWGHFKVKLLRDADVLMLPAERDEMLEGMAAGVVPVGENNEDAEAVALSIARLHADRAELARLSQGGRQRVQSAFSLERLADDLSAIYSILIQWPASQAG